MFITSLELNNIRNHINSKLNPSNGLNIIVGKNGAGKTTILEAISILGFTKSFIPSHDSSLIRKGSEFYQVSAEAMRDIDVHYKINVKYSAQTRKQISSSLGEKLTPKEVIGEIPIVLLSPDMKSITFGSPEDRRSFIDRILSQSSRLYFEELYKLRRTLKQRNALLYQLKTEKTNNYSMLNTWTEALIMSSAEIIRRRYLFFLDFVEIFKTTYQIVANNYEDANLVYCPNGIEPELLKANNSIQNIQNLYRNLADRLRNAELQRGTTLFGPQKDELKILLNSGIAKEYASQGQHKSLLISIKFAEFEYLKQKKFETPIILLDDIFSELDSERSLMVFDIVKKNSAQTFVTGTDLTIFHKLLPSNSIYRFFNVEQGIITED